MRTSDSIKNICQSLKDLGYTEAGDKILEAINAYRLELKGPDLRTYNPEDK